MNKYQGANENGDTLEDDFDLTQKPCCDRCRHEGDKGEQLCGNPNCPCHTKSDVEDVIEDLRTQFNGIQCSGTEWHDLEKFVSEALTQAYKMGEEKFIPLPVEQMKEIDGELYVIFKIPNGTIRFYYTKN